MPTFLQRTLFEDERNAVAGLSYLPDYIDPIYEDALICQIDNQPWLADLKRRVQHYGYKYDYKARAITRDLRLGPIPDWLSGLCQKLRTGGIFLQTPDQVIINEYLPGQGITPHIDCVPCFGETIASLSLGSSCVMEFTHNKTAEKLSQLMEPCSLIILSGEARYDWQHAIPGRKTDSWNGMKLARRRRISLTFRNIILQSPA